MVIRLRSMRAIAGIVMLGCAMIGMTATPAPAQFGQAVAISELMKPEFLNRDMIVFVEGLDLDDQQQIIVEAMFDDYRTNFESGLAQLRASFEAMRTELNPDDPDRVLKMVFAPFERWRVERETLREQFLQNVKLVLSEQQLSKWDAFQMQLLREKTLDRGVLSGESLNIFHVLKEMRIDERTWMSIEPILNEYAMELDRALKARNEAIDDTQGNMLQALQQQDSAKMLQVMDRQIDRRVVVRDVNDRYVQAITAALSSPLSEQFYTNAMERGYPRIYRRNSADELYEAALAHADLDPDIKSSVRELYATYRDTVENMNRRLLEMIRAHEPESERHRARAAAARMNNEPYSRLPNPSVVEYRKRDEMVRESVDLLKWTVGDEIFMSLPGASRWIRPKRTETPQQRINTGGSPAQLNSGAQRQSTLSGGGAGGKGGRSNSSDPSGASSGNKKRPNDPNDPGPPDE